METVRRPVDVRDWVLGGGGRKDGMNRRNIEDFEGSENPLMTPCW